MSGVMITDFHSACMFSKPAVLARTIETRANYFFILSVKRSEKL